MCRPGSRTIESPVSRTDPRIAAAYSSAVGAGVPSYEMPRLEIHDLRPDVRVQADDLEAGSAAHAVDEIAGLVDRHAELVGLEAGGDVGMAAGVDVRVDADRHLGARLPFPGDRVEPFQLSRGLGVDRPHAELHGLRQFGVGLRHAGEDDLRGDEAGAQRDVDLPARVGVDAAAEAAQQAHQRERRVGFQGVVDGVRVVAERGVDGAIAGGDGRRAIDVERRPVDAGDLGERNAVTFEDAVPAGEGGHDTTGNCTACGPVCRRGFCPDCHWPAMIRVGFRPFTT
jgi:hypothetical protein